MDYHESLIFVFLIKFKISQQKGYKIFLQRPHFRTPERIRAAARTEWASSRVDRPPLRPRSATPALSTLNRRQTLSEPRSRRSSYESWVHKQYCRNPWNSDFGDHIIMFKILMIFEQQTSSSIVENKEKRMEKKEIFNSIPIMKSDDELAKARKSVVIFRADVYQITEKLWWSNGNDNSEISLVSSCSNIVILKIPISVIFLKCWRWTLYLETAYLKSNKDKNLFILF